MARIAPALLAGDFARLGDVLRVVERAGGSLLHLDVADGHFAGEITLGLPVIESIRRATRLSLDVHLLIERPERFVTRFVRAGADRVAVHPESTPHLFGVLQLIRQTGARAGVALEPGTPLARVEDVLEQIDFLTILGAVPEFIPGVAEKTAPPEFVPEALRKLRRAFDLRGESGLSFEIEAEGGVGLKNFDDLLGAGADILVGDFAIFQTSEAVSKLSELIRKAARPARTQPGSRPPAEKVTSQGS